MVKQFLLLAGAALLIAGPANATPIGVPGPTLSVNDVAVPVAYDPNTGEGSVTNYSLSIDGDTITVNATTFNDPFASLGINFTDNGPANQFFAALDVPITPLSGKISLSANAIVTGLDNVDIPNGGSLTPALALVPSTYTAFDVNGEIVLSLVTAPVTYGPGGSSSENADNFGDPLIIDCSLLPGGQCTSISIAFGVNGAGGGDLGSVLASLTVREIPDVAEPLTLALFGVGLTGIAFARRKYQAA